MQKIKLKKYFNKIKIKKINKKDIIDGIKKYFTTNILFLSFVGTSILMALVLRLLTIGYINEIKALLCDILVVMFFGAFGYLIKPKNQFKYFLTVSIVFTALCVINHVYYQFYTTFVSVSLVSSVKMVGEVSDSVTSKLKLIYFIYLLAPIFLIYINKVLKKKEYYERVGKTEKGFMMFRKTGLFSVIGILLVGLTITSTETSRLVKLWNRDYVVGRFGLYTYTLTDAVMSIYPIVSPMFGYDDAAKEFKDFYLTEGKQTKEENKYTNIFEGKNVIFIHAESIQNFLIDLEVNGTVITPNLNKLAHSGMYFSSFYPQISIGTSSDTEFTLSTGLLPSSSGTVFVNYYDRKYESIQNAFNNKGYYTFSMHANSAPYWNRQTMYKTLGYQEFYAKDSYVVPEDKNDPNYIGLGLSDKSFYEQIMPILNNIKETKQPFMGTIISLSNHSPFNDVTKYGNLDFSITFDKETTEVDENGNFIKETVTVPYLENTEMGNYLKSAHYADEAYGLLFELLDQNGLLENTVIVLYGDHESKLGKKNLNLLYNYDPLTDSIKNEEDPTYISLNNYKYDLLKNTPLIIWTKDQKLKSEIKDVMGMWDVFPTIANMFNLNCSYALGHDIFSSNEKIVVFPNNDILTNKVFYNNLKDEYIMLGEEPLETDYIDRIKAYAELRLNVSKDAIVHNLFQNEKLN